MGPEWGLGDLIRLAPPLVLVAALAVFLLWRWLSAPRRELERLEREMVARDQDRYAAEQSWVAAGEWPLTDHSVYLTAWEFTQDLARMKALGYDLEWQEHLEDGTIAATYVLTPAYQQRSASGGRL